MALPLVEYKLGRLPSPPDERTLDAARYLRAVVTPPKAVDYGRGVKSWPLYSNDRIGNCTAASMAHQIQAWTTVAKGKTSKPLTRSVLKLYSAVTGYDPKDPSTDNGAMEIDVLRYMRKVGLAGHKIHAFASLKPSDLTKNQQALWAFGGLYLGFDLPLTAQGQKTWDVVRTSSTDDEPGSWGGHAVTAVAFDANGVTVISWGKTVKVSWEFWGRYCSESWALISPDWINAGKTPNGVDLPTLNKDLAALGKVG